MSVHAVWYWARVTAEEGCSRLCRGSLDQRRERDSVVSVSMKISEEELGEVAWSVFRRYRQIQIESFHSILRQRLLGSAVVSAGYSHSIAVRADGTICLWGNMKQGIAPGRYRVQNMSPMPDPNAPLPYSGIQVNPMELPTGEVSWFENKGMFASLKLHKG